MRSHDSLTSVNIAAEMLMWALVIHYLCTSSHMTYTAAPPVFLYLRIFRPKSFQTAQFGEAEKTSTMLINIAEKGKCCVAFMCMCVCVCECND